MPRNGVTLITFIGLIAFIVILIVFKPEEKHDQPTAEYLTGKVSRKPEALSNDALMTLVSSIDITDFQTILSPILVERVVGTAGHEDVKNYIIEEMKSLKWTVELDAFYDYTPNRKKLKFTNIIATNNPNSSKFLVLSCHYDSLLATHPFIGATDSAVPCAMLIYLAKNLNIILSDLGQDISLKLIFFDGEEAFVQWTATDSLYGARHLAGVMEAKTYQLGSGRSFNDLNKMALFVLLDLLGAPSPQFYSYFRNTNKWYSSMVSIEKRLLSLRLLRAESDGESYVPYFNNQSNYGARIEDDHKPFLKKGVPVLHVIPIPFPEVWHTKYDDASAINLNTIYNLLAIFKVFTVQYLLASSGT